MTYVKKLAKKLSSDLGKKQDVLEARTGVLGDGYGKLLTGVPNQVYVTVGGALDVAICKKIPAKYGIHVRVGYSPEEPNLYQILSAEGTDPSGIGLTLGGYAKAERYRFLSVFDGADPLWLEKRAWLPLRIGMTVPPSKSVALYEGNVWTGTAFAYLPHDEIDLESYIPTTEGKALLLMITVDSNGSIVLTDGSEVDVADLCPEGDEFANSPDVPIDTAEVLALIRLYTGQSVIQEGRLMQDGSNRGFTDFVDVRGLYSLAGGGGGTVETVTGDGVDNTDPANPVIALSADDLTDVDTTTDAPAKNEVLKWNGTNWVPAVYNASFTFSIASFSDGESSPQEIGSGVWKAIGAISFTATYNNGPAAATPYVSKSGWSNLDMTGTDYEGPTTNAEAVNYPSVGASITFQLNATDGEDADTATQSVAFYNRRFWGVSSVTGSYSEANVEGLANNELSNSKAKTFTVTPGAGEYIIFAYPSRLGTATFTVGGFEGGFESPETVSITNASGYTEDYYVYRSTNPNLGSTTVVTS